MPNRAADKLYHRVNHLFAETLKGGTNAEEAWEAIRSLRGLGCQLVFDRVKAWCSSPEPTKRTRAANVLSQLRRLTKPKPPFGSTSEQVFRDESFALIARMLEHEEHLDALKAEIYAFGHLDDIGAVPLITHYVNHPSEDVRYALAFSLGSLHEHPASVAALTKLAGDPDKDVRDWAIFGLGVQGNADSEELRQLFLAHLNDPFEPARVEAVASLAKRKDARVVPMLIKTIRNTGPGRVLLEAARDLLEIDEDPPDWYAKEYIAALEAKFPAALNPDGTQHTVTSR